MVARFTNEKTIVLGYGAYHKIKNSFLNKLIRYETLLTAIQYFSLAKIRDAFYGSWKKPSLYSREDIFIKLMDLLNI